MRWTGEVKAFAYYMSSDCNPRERNYTLFAGRKVFEDGSTTTVVRSVLNEPGIGQKPLCQSEGIIERDSTGSAAYIGTQFALFESPKSAPKKSASEFNLDSKTGILTGWGTFDDIHHSKNLALPDRRAYFLDPIEALAFGFKESMASGWLFPAGTYGCVDGRAKSVGLRIVFGPEKPFAVELNGKREMFRRIDMTRIWIGSSVLKAPEDAGSLLFGQDGKLAAYAPIHGLVRLPSSITWVGGVPGQRKVQPPPFALTGQLGKEWEAGLDTRLRQTLAFNMVCGVFVPKSVSAADQAAVLATIPDRLKPVEKEKPGDGGDRVVPPQ